MFMHILICLLYSGCPGFHFRSEGRAFWLVFFLQRPLHSASFLLTFDDM